MSLVIMTFEIKNAPCDETRSSKKLSGKLLEIEHRAEGRAATPSSAMPSGKLPKQV